MIEYTVEATMGPVEADDWSNLRRFLDVVPGTMLIEDALAPLLIVPVPAGSPARAAMFVDGLAALLSIESVSSAVYPTPTADFDVFDDAEESAPVVEDATAALARSWVQDFGD